MTWFKIDDAFWRSRKVRKLGRDRLAAAGLWTLSGAWAADNLTDGFVPWEVVEDWDPNRRLAERLIAVELWEPDSDGGEEGIRFHDWNDWQPAKRDVMAERAYNARKSALYRDPELLEAVRNRDRDRCRYCGAKVNWKDRRSAAGGTYNSVDPSGQLTLANLVVGCRRCSSEKGDRTPEQAGMPLLEPGALAPGTGTQPVQNQNTSGSYLDTNQIGTGFFLDPGPTRPDPTRPDPTRPDPGLPTEDPGKSSSSRARPRTRLPETWRPTDKHRAYAADKGLELETQRQLFAAHAEAHDRRCASWNGAFTQWLIKADEIQRDRRRRGEHLRPIDGGRAPRRQGFHCPPESAYDEPLLTATAPVPDALWDEPILPGERA